MNLEESQTKQNLITAYLRESGAFNEYTYYAEQAKTEGYREIYNVFTQFAHNEQAHAEIWFKLWHGIAGTTDNLKDAADLENYERTVMYSEFAKTARKEGFEDIAKLFDGVAEVEKAHEQKYKSLFERLSSGKYFEQPQEVAWKCLNCGHIHYGKQPPENCPVCSHPEGYFMLSQQNG